MLKHSVQTTSRILLGAILFCSPMVWADIKLPKLISDGMVLQRHVSLPVWGWADPQESVQVQFLEKTFKTEADVQGRWQVSLPPLDAGGPYTMAISGDNVLQLQDIWVGDVWVASGQSNMELPMRRLAPLYEEERTNANDPQVRFFTVPQEYDFNTVRDDFSGGQWQGTTPEAVQNFSGVAYFFAQQINQTEQVPVGIIHASLGGSPAQAWMSEAALKEFPHYRKQTKRVADPKEILRIEAADTKRRDAWYNGLNKRDKGFKKGNYVWSQENVKTKAWDTINIPGEWSSEKEPFSGVAWLRKEIEVPEHLAGQPALLVLGKIIDADKTFINGQLVGETGYRYPPRRYPVPAGVLKAGLNTITVRVISEQGTGRFVADKTYQLQWPDTRLVLAGEWHYRVGATAEPLASQTFVRWQPGGLFNGMLAPLFNYPMQGVIWYQGESNVGAAEEYQQLFPALIADWRKAWGLGDFPFLFVQLANYQMATEQPSDSAWARLREAQLMTEKSVPNTAMVVATDIGEWNDIHPLDKRSVADRLALAAQKLVYKKDIVHSGPTFQAFTIESNKAVIQFKNTGAGLTTSDNNAPAHIAIAGEDRKFVWAEAMIRDNELVVWSDEVVKPVAVRYAWADDPDGANLANKDGLPASSFRTDDW